MLAKFPKAFGRTFPTATRFAGSHLEVSLPLMSKYTGAPVALSIWENLTKKFVPTGWFSTTRVSFVPPPMASGEYTPMLVILLTFLATLKLVVQLKFFWRIFTVFNENSNPLFVMPPTLS